MGHHLPPHHHLSHSLHNGHPPPTTSSSPRNQPSIGQVNLAYTLFLLPSQSQSHVFRMVSPACHPYQQQDWHLCLPTRQSTQQHLLKLARDLDHLLLHQRLLTPCLVPLSDLLHRVTRLRFKQTPFSISAAFASRSLYFGVKAIKSGSHDRAVQPQLASQQPKASDRTPPCEKGELDKMEANIEQR